MEEFAFGRELLDGERLARWALNRTYGYLSCVPSGPLFRQFEVRDGAAYLSCDYAEGLHSADGAPLRTFEVAEQEDLFTRANLVNGEGLPASTFRSSSLSH